MPVETIHLTSYSLAKLRDIFSEAMAVSEGAEAAVEIEGVGFVTFSPLVSEPEPEPAPLHGEMAMATDPEPEPEPSQPSQPKPKRGIVSVEANG